MNAKKIQIRKNGIHSGARILAEDWRQLPMVASMIVEAGGGWYGVKRECTGVRILMEDWEDGQVLAVPMPVIFNEMVKVGGSVCCIID